MFEKFFDFLDRILPGKGWRTIVGTAIVGGVLNLLAGLGIIIDDQLTTAVNTIVMVALAYLFRRITTGPMGTK